jgi:hypothetical protein
MAQVAQLSEAQLLQESPPTDEVMPLSSAEKQAKVDSIRPASCWHSGQAAPSLHWLTGRNFSNFESQSLQTYSYIGIFVSPTISLSTIGK